jgi:hypothetical protein
MPDARNYDAHDYAERILERLSRRLQEIREAASLTSINKVQVLDIPGDPAREEVWR